jgi:hypothetical protein
MEATSQLLEERQASTDGAEQQTASTNDDALLNRQRIRFDGFFTGPTW